MNRAIFLLYRAIFGPLLIFSLPLLALSNAKIRRGLNMRRRKFVALKGPLRPIWIHAASGEFEYAKAVIRELKASRPGSPILVTYFSPTYAANAETFPGVDLAVALPLDLPGPCRTFVKRYNPQYLLIARTDLWPEMMEQCRLRAIPVYLMSYTQKDPARLSSIKRWLVRWRLSWIDHIYCVSPADLKNVQALWPEAPASVQGDTRYDQVRFRLDNPKVLPAELKPEPTIPCLVAGSTWPEDEAVLLPALKEHLKARKLKLILTPHEPTPDHLSHLKRDLEKLGLTYALYSDQRAWHDQEVLLVDRVGVLAELYLWGQLAFVGGSYRKTVHSVMEALGAGCFTFVGPLHLNNREAIEFKNLKLGPFQGLIVAETAEQWRAELDGILDRPEKIKDFKARLLGEFNKRLGASRALVETLD